MFNLLEKFYEKFLIYKSIKFFKKYHFTEIYPEALFENEFSKLCEKYKTDKGGLIKNKEIRKFHFYSSFYDNVFKEKKEYLNLIFECGIGSNNIKIQSNIVGKSIPGASLRVLQEYFPNAHIFAADIDDKILFKDNRISTLYVDQLNQESIIEMWKKIKKNNFDLIIDDGLHTFDAGLTFFKNSFSYLKSGGLYVIEDVHVAYLEKLTTELYQFKPTIITSNIKNNIDDYLLVIKKN